MAASVRGDRQENVLDGTPFDLAAAQTGKPKSRVPEMLVGTFLVALFALAGAWFYSTSTQSTSYLAIRQDVQRGAVITNEDLSVFQITTDAPLVGTSNLALSSVVGKVALVDMKVGTLITENHLADKAQIPRGQGIVGLDLAPGEFPTFSLRPGDRVRVVIMPAGSASLSSEDISVVGDDVEVVEVATGNGRERFISLSLSAELADLVAAADSQDRVRLVQVPGN